MSRFEPLRANGEALRRAMDRSLWASSAEVLGLADLDAAYTRRATPLDYGAYADLALEIPAWQSCPEHAREEARDHLRMRLEEAPGSRRAASRIPSIRNFSRGNYSAVQLDRLNRWLATEEAVYLGLAEASGAELERVRGEIVRALATMEQADPELFGEIVALIDDIIVVTPDGGQRFEFTAGSSFALWGGIIANTDMLADWTEVYNMLAHEAGHILLFALARDEPLVLNDDADLFASPVRDDPRPMDGIYHAAFVASRETRAHDRLLGWHWRTGMLSPADVKLVEDSLESSVIVFWQAVEILEKHGKLSALGQSIIDEAKDYVGSNFALVTEPADSD